MSWISEGPLARKLMNPASVSVLDMHNEIPSACITRVAEKKPHTHDMLLWVRTEFLSDRWNRVKTIKLTTASNKTVHRDVKTPLGLPFLIFFFLTMLNGTSCSHFLPNKMSPLSQTQPARQMNTGWYFAITHPINTASILQPPSPHPLGETDLFVFPG